MQKKMLTLLFRLYSRFGLLLLILAPFLQGCDTREQNDTPLETLPMEQVSLASLEAFQSGAGNWQIAGGVESDRQVEHDLTPLQGSGVLVNLPTEQKKDHLLTRWNHGDLELELDFLMPKGSNSGIYLMGRYEVQLLDSWGIGETQFSDLGGIYQRWDESRAEGQKGYEGNAPLLNAARAPGLWQHCKILFQAPEFDKEGNKTANAQFKEVWLNGVLVQEDVEVSGPTRAAAFEDEASEGPLMIQGDHGPVAVRNIEYKRYDQQRIRLDSLTYAYYPGEFSQMPDFDSLEATETSSTDSLAGNVITDDARYALRYTGTLHAPNAGRYLFKLRNAGMVRMVLDGKTVFDQTEIHRMHELDAKTLDLQEGSHKFTFEYVKHPNDWYWGLSLFAEGPQLRLQKLHATSSVPGGESELPDLMVRAEERVKTLRSFAMHNGVKRTHVINVGDPKGIHFSYDMGQAALLKAWEGPFINANEMWINRGEPQTADPAGPPLIFDGYPSMALLGSNGTAWPDSVSWNRLDVQGYTLLERGLPVFQYAMGEVQVKDRLEAFQDPRRLVRTVAFEAPESRDDFWFQLASGKEIRQKEDGEFVVDDRTYYLKVLDTGTSKPEIVQTDRGYDLRIPLLAEDTRAEIKYEIIW